MDVEVTKIDIFGNDCGTQDLTEYLMSEAIWFIDDATNLGFLDLKWDWFWISLEDFKKVVSAYGECV